MAKEKKEKTPNTFKIKDFGDKYVAGLKSKFTFQFGGAASQHLSEEVETILILAVDRAAQNAARERNQKIAKLKGEENKERREELRAQNIIIKPRHIPRVADGAKTQC